MKLKVKWDEKKNQANIIKHGISFELAVNVFRDKNRLDFYDERHSRDEDRYITIGMVQDLIVVVYTERYDAIRMISARIANRKEREKYNDQNYYFRFR